MDDSISEVKQGESSNLSEVDNSHHSDGGSTAVGTDMAAAPSSSMKGQSNINKLTKEELLMKCKHLISIAQKAKTAKDDAVADLKQSHEKANKEQEVLMEMVNNLTESKMALTVKNESLQRQLDVASSELETLQTSQDQLAKSRQEAQARTEVCEARLAHMKERFESRMLAEREKQEMFAMEKDELQEKMVCLEAQASQVEALKVKCKKFMEENAHLEEASKQVKGLVAEKKANEIIMQETISQKKKLEEQVKNLSENIKQLHAINVKAENTLNSQEKEIADLSIVLNTLQQKHSKDEMEETNEVFIMQKKIDDYETKCTKLEEIIKKLTEKSELTEITEIIETITTSSNTDSNLESYVKNLFSKVELEDNATKKNQEKVAIEEMILLSTKNEALIENLQNDAEKHTTDMNRLEQLLCEANEKCSDYVIEIQNLKENLNKITTEAESANQECCLLKSQLKSFSELEKNYLLTTKELDALKNCVNESNLQMEEQKIKLEKSKIRCERDRVQIDELQQSVTGLSDELKDVTRQKNELQHLAENSTKLDQIQQLYQDLEFKFNERNVTVTYLEKEVKDLLFKIQEYETLFGEQKLKLSVVVDTMRQIFAEKSCAFPSLKSILVSENVTIFESEDNEFHDFDKLNIIFNRLEEYCLSMKISVEDIAQKNTELNNEINAVKDSKEMLQNQLKDFQTIHDDLNFLISELKKSNSVDKEMLIEMKKSEEKLIQEYSSKQINLKSEIEELHNVCQKQAKSISEYISEKSVMNNRIENILQENAEVTKKQVCASQFENKVTELENQIVILKDNEATYVSTINGQQNEIECIQVKLKSIEAEYNQKISALTIECETARKDFIDVTEDREVCKLNMSRLEADLTKFNLEYNRNKEELEKTQLIISNSESKLLDIIAEREEVNKEFSELKKVNKLNIQTLHTVQKNHKELLIKSHCDDRQISELKCELNRLKHDLNSLSGINKDMESKFKDYETERNSHQVEIEGLSKQIEEMSTKIEINDSKLVEISAERQQLQKVNDELGIVHASCLKELSSATEQCQQLQLDHDRLTAELLQEREERSNFQEKLASSTARVQQLEEVGKENIARASVAEAAAQREEEKRQQLEEQEVVAAARCQELLQELNEVTGVLRERGERISRLEAALKTRSSELEEQQDELERLRVQVLELENEKQSALSRLETEEQRNTTDQLTKQQQKQQQQLTRQQQKQQAAAHTAAKHNENLQKSAGNSGSDAAAAAGPDNQSEVLSTSTISKAEEVHRMRDLEDTFEERYMKLKSVAIKLKKRLAEQTLQMNAAEECKSKLLAEKEQLASVKTASRNIQVLQGEVDRLQDSLESNGRALRDRDNQLTATVEQLAAARDQLTKQDEQLDHLQARVKALEEAHASQKTREAELQVKIITLQEQAHGHEEEEQKARSLLALELQDAERVTAELRSEVEKREAEVMRERHEEAALRQRVAALEEQLQHLTAQRVAEDTTAEQLQKGYDDARALLSEAETEVMELRQSKQEQAAEVERLRQEVESQKVMVTEVSQSKIKVEELARYNASRSATQVALLEEQLESVSTELQQTGDELQHVRVEFEGYKARAQSVLKQQKQCTGTDVSELQQRLQLAETQLQTLQHTNRTLQSEVSSLQSEQRFLQSEKERLIRQQRQEAECAAQGMAAALDDQTRLEQQLQRLTAENQAVIAKMAAEGEAMAASYEGQIKSRTEVHQRELLELQCQLDAVRRQLETTTTAFSGGEATSKTGHRRLDSTDDGRVDVTTMIREEGEGSEWVDSSPHVGGSGHLASLHHEAAPYRPPPLDLLLTAPLEDDLTSVSGSAADNMACGSGLVTALQEKVEAYEIRVKQVSSLLHESEAENAKLSQLTDALKEEIRRGSRNQDREKHLENLEYLKNVVLQFLTLGESGADGRERLLPVLTTLLQLAPHEAERIRTMVAGDGSGGASQGWSSYLHMWSGR